MRVSFLKERLWFGVVTFALGFILGVGFSYGAWKYVRHRRQLSYQPRQFDNETSGFLTVNFGLQHWEPNASLEDISRIWSSAGHRFIDSIDKKLAKTESFKKQIPLVLKKAAIFAYQNQPRRSYEILEQLRSCVEKNDEVADAALYNIIYLQGVYALRLGETENCVMCRGESSCILPISSAAVHTKPEGSRLAIGHFAEYLEQFPNDLEVRWLLNLAYMTLGEHPQKVDPRFVISLDRFTKSEFDIGVFRDIGHIVGVNRFNQAGGAIMEDFDNDGQLDLAVTTMDPTAPMVLYRNTGTGTFEDCTAAAGLTDQLGGLYCVQADYNNDGYMDIFIVRGAWLQSPIRPSLLRNNRDFTFTDVTLEAGLIEPVNSIAASWADFDNDGWLDLFICCERQPNKLYRNLGYGIFEEVARTAGVDQRPLKNCKGAAWIDYDNDGYSDLFLNYMTPKGQSCLFRNNHNGTFSDVSREMNVDGPVMGFSCWAWDYDNDGWQDIFAVCYDKTLEGMVQGLLGQPHNLQSSRLYRNQQGRGFEDKSKEAGLDLVLVAMGSNFGDFDNDGFLDMYLATGDPTLEFLDPSRMFKNVGGKRFAEITGTSRTGNLQKGHAVACGDWDRDGDIDIFAQMGGAAPGDRYHNILFQNPGQGHHWITIKLVGQKTNRAAIGARIKVVTAGDDPLTVCRHVSSGSSFGGNPLEQMIGLADAEQIATLEIHWPTSGTTQVFRNVTVDQVLEITEFAEDYRKLDWLPIAFTE